ncbi:hypothetical protein CHRY9390_03103 [Chryseobacterium aquaeductus]|uniref:DUF4249 domain-containing protein n=1 Tax=Chryseobacterium aquaeductus TaxID=2675056 RepID=A0A9N8QRS8_9FLAO|nr:DUF4249 domain-containing protein [Chryseobacterium aquaeductus]CAA7332381.1 hypothetical protein CHRY9390_03103 [Chryseobacterium potabilaquae]CAD7816114.1 hypothetical protein CHRY9390_03103 [Chryseobacterium aquaeductus]
MKNICLLIISLFFFTNCEKEIDLDLDDRSGNIVIEANVTDQAGPYYVKITKSVAFTAGNTYPVVNNAVVILSDDNGQTETLNYIGEGFYETVNFTTAPGRTYTLKVTAEGKEFTAKSTMPQPVLLENLQQDSFEVAGELSYTLLPIFTDPSTLGNRYLFSYTLNSNPNKTFEAFSDNVNNGSVNQRPLLLPNDDEDGISEKTKVGDIINVEMQCIDAAVYTYYTSLLEIIGGGGPGGGITPTNPPSNITNGALGYFSAHTVSKKSYVIQ